jgi:CDGSH-type Zn-finger protein
MFEERGNAVNSNPATFRIKIIEDGPYLVTGGVPLVQRYPAKSVDGEPLEWDPVGAQLEPTPVSQRYRLCRCGHSAKMPYCDGSHSRHGFVGALTADRRPIADRRKARRGAGITLYDDPTLCASAGFCATCLTDVWQMVERTNDPEVRARLLHMILNCPSGRLEASLGDGDLVEPQYLPSIAVVPDGPLWVRGGIPLEAPDGFVYEVRDRMTLCRCGHSGNMPFCDGTHEAIDFQAP